MVEITNSKIADYEIQLFDENSNLIYSMETESPIEDLTKRYNLSGLEDGNYLYIVKTNLEKVTKHLAIEDGQVHVMDIRKTLSPYVITSYSIHYTKLYEFFFFTSMSQ